MELPDQILYHPPKVETKDKNKCTQPVVQNNKLKVPWEAAVNYNYENFS